MDYSELQNHLGYLESLTATDAPVISCYLDVTVPYRQSFNERVRAVTAGLRREKGTFFWEMLGRVEVFLSTGIWPETSGVAIFGRGGKEPFFLPLQFDVPFPNAVHLTPTPEISALVEFRDAMFVPPPLGEPARLAFAGYIN